MTRSRCNGFWHVLGMWSSAALASAVWILAGARSAQAGVNVWTSHGPPGGLAPTSITALAIDPLTPTTLYATTPSNDVFEVIKSTDGGRSWVTANTGLPGNLAFFSALAVDPLTPSTLYVFAPGLFKSTDAGANWESTGLSGARILAIDPVTPSTLYAATGGVSKSTDGGDSWSAADTGLPVTSPVAALAVDPHNPSTLYAGTSSSGVFKSTDSGASWSAINTGLDDLNVNVLAIDPATPNTLYAGTVQPGSFQFPTPTPSGSGAADAGEALTFIPYFGVGGCCHPPDRGQVYKSTDGGASWSAAGSSFGPPLSALAFDPRTSTTLYASTRGSAFKSTDAGGTWTGLRVGATVAALAVNPLTSTTLYAAGNDVHKSTDAGRTWKVVSVRHPAIEPANLGIPVNSAVTTLVIDPLRPTTLYAGTSSLYASADNGVSKSLDAGDTWRSASTDLPTSLGIMGLAIDPLTPATLYARTNAGLFKSTDAAGTWMLANTGLPGGSAVSALAIDPDTPRILYAGTNPTTGGMFKSTDAGATWTESNTGIPDSLGILAFAIDPDTPSTLYAGTWSQLASDYNGVFKSTDGGATWSTVNTGLGNQNVDALAIDPANPSTLYAGAYGGVFKSTNSGASWNPVNAGLGNININALIVDPATPITLYAGTYYGGVFKSTDAGASWSSFNKGLRDTALINALAIDPHSPTTVYAATDAGVFDIEQVAAASCDGDCNGDQTVSIVEVLVLVNLALGDGQAFVCPNGIANGTTVDVPLIIQAVNHALTGCGV